MYAARTMKMTGIAALSLGLMVCSSFAQEGSKEKVDSFLRVADVKGKSISLEIASRDYVPKEGVGPKVTLIGVAHIGDRTFYRALQRQMSDYDVVLYESVLPSGAKGAGGESDSERIESTRAAMGFVGSLIETHFATTNEYPENLEAVAMFAAKQDDRLGQWVGQASVDAWDQVLVYERDDEDLTYTLRSYGADGKPGGMQANADLDLADQETPQALDFSAEDDNIQAQLAEVLKLSFQLHVLDYGQDNWRCSDMAMDQVDRALAERGVEFELVSGALGGTSLFARMAKLFLGVIRFADVLLEGAVSDTFKVLLIEMLSDETLMEMSMSQFGEGFDEVIVDMRNQVVIDDLKAMIESEKDVQSVAILYGAAHMKDMAERLDEQLDYEPIDARWYKAIGIDLERSVVSEREIRQMRGMMKQAMRMQMPRK